MNLKDPEGWQKAQDANQDPYGGACIEVARNIMAKLDDAEFEITDVVQIICDEEGGLTMFQAGAVSSMIAAFHERGDEWRRAWNLANQIQDEGEKANEKGTILNPAVMNVDSRKLNE
jgi:hypothetical protein